MIEVCNSRIDEPISVEPKPFLVIRSARGPLGVNLWEVWQFRDLLVSLASRDLKLRYRQTALGAAWVVVQPLIAAGIFTVVFGHVAKLPSDGIPYFLFAYAGMIGWTAFSITLTKSSTCLVQHSNLITKIFFPRMVLPFSTVYSTLIDLAVSLAMMAALMLAYHIPPTAGMLLLPLWLLLTFMIAVGLGLFASALMVSYRDVQYVVPVLIQFLLYASPVAYSVAAVPGRIRLFYAINPLSGLMESIRWSLLGRGTLAADHVAYSAACAVIVFVGGVLYFSAMEERFADVI